LVIVGRHDPSTPPSDGRVICEGVSGARMFELDSAHLANVERADEFTAAVAEFLNA
jgi:3-oxoadipate enol-lactonase